MPDPTPVPPSKSKAGELKEYVCDFNGKNTYIRSNFYLVEDALPIIRALETENAELRKRVEEADDLMRKSLGFLENSGWSVASIIANYIKKHLLTTPPQERG